MVGIALQEVRKERGWARRVIAGLMNVSESLVNEWENSRRQVTNAMRERLARKIDDGRVYMAMGRESTGGPMMPPWLDGIDGHRLACALKTIEELEEASAAIKKLMPVLVMQPDRITEAAKQTIAETMMEIIESVTASENTCARLARIYGISLAELWDQHESELIEKGYLLRGKIEKSPFKGPKINISYRV